MPLRPICARAVSANCTTELRLITLCGKNLISDDTTRWTPLPDGVDATPEKTGVFLDMAKRIRATFLKGAALSKEELRFGLSGEVDAHLHRRISDRIRALGLLERLHELSVSDLIWLSYQRDMFAEEKAAISRAIARSSISRRRKIPAPRSSAPSAQNDKSAEFPPNIVRER